MVAAQPRAQDLVYIAIMELPNDLIKEILVRLPLKDILSYKCVCREWYMLISNPNFTTYYAQHSPFTTIFLDQYHFCTKSLSLLEFSPNGDFTQIRIKPKIPEFQDINSNGVTIIGSCDGWLFLLYHAYRPCYLDDRVIDKIYFCNPLFERCVEIAQDRSPWGDLDYKVGYIPSTNNYKLLRILYNRNRVEEAKIFTIGVDKDWRIVEDPFTFWEPGSDYEGVCFNGAYHWVTDNENLDNICTFDLLEEKCSAIPNPPGLLPFSSENVKLTILSDRLSVVDYSDCSQMNIWTMEKYGVAESWFRNISILESWIPHQKHLINFLPIAVLRNGNLIFSQMYPGNSYYFSLGKKQCTPFMFLNVDGLVGETMYENAFGPRFYSLEGIESGGQ
ncbi:hypothetical protein DH2020_005836 [Rehmannia glutinosa]|uniref:F-box domain-containing protein n=1 Tax=Rehmannia glutinosa TaxID=99300 RepID=A0ABR0XH85_REHGL